MESTQEKNKRIAKNTLLLYCRTFITMCISLFTSRLILEALGIDNYGIYNVVGGFVSMFSIISGSLSSSVSRYLTYGLGKGDLEELKKIFSSSINVQAILALVIILVGETVGVWYVNCEMNLPPDRLYAANWVLQCSVFTFVIGLLSTPYNASIVAHEKMSIYAYFSIIEVALKLIFVYLLFVTPFDKLITYAVLLALISLIMQGSYYIYCKRKFKECHYQFTFDKKKIKGMTSFAWWSFFGNTAYMFNTQGVNMAVNSFFGVVFNAARGIVTQAEGAIMSLVNNFTMAFNPQITKSYAEGNKEYMLTLMNRGAKFSFFLFLFILIPFELCADTILGIWLKEVPDKAPLFLRLSLLCSGTLLLGNSYLTAIFATGNIRNYEIAVTVVGCLVFPFSLGAYYLGAPVETSYVIFLFIYNVLVWIRMYYIKKLLSMPITDFVKSVIIPILKVTPIAFLFPFAVWLMLDNAIVRFIVTIPVSILSTCISIYYLGLQSNEKTLISSKISGLLVKLGIKTQTPEDN